MNKVSGGAAGGAGVASQADIRSYLASITTIPGESQVVAEPPASAKVVYEHFSNI